MPARKIVTVHAPMAPRVSDAILTPAIELMERFGFTWWYSTDALPDISLYIDSPKVWTERAPTPRELDRFYELWEAGRKDEARALAKTGLPRSQR